MQGMRQGVAKNPDPTYKAAEANIAKEEREEGRKRGAEMFRDVMAIVRACGFIECKMLVKDRAGNCFEFWGRK